MIFSISLKVTESSASFDFLLDPAVSRCMVTRPVANVAPRLRAWRRFIICQFIISSASQLKSDRVRSMDVDQPRVVTGITVSSPLVLYATGAAAAGLLQYPDHEWAAKF